MLIDGKALAHQIEEELKAEISMLPGRKPCLAVLLIGDYPPSKIYVNRKTESCLKIGIKPLKRDLSSEISEAALLQEIADLNEDASVDGILVQLPLPPQIDPMKVSLAIDPRKDVDGFHPINLGKLLLGEKDGMVPCTPLGIQELLISANAEVEGKHVVILGRSNIVGKPLAALLMQKGKGANATVTVANSQTRDLKRICKEADILIAAMGSPLFVDPSYVKEGAYVIDVGINKLEDPTKAKGYRIVGDVDFDAVYPLCKAITPVPGGVGPMTIALLLKNTLKAYRSIHETP